MKKKYRCFALFSGGLDSILSVIFMKKLGYDVLPIFLKTPFFGPENALKAAENISVELIVHDVSKQHLEMLRNPRYGFGKNMNPCIDCHGLMFREASLLMEEYNVDFLISGEVLGQRPMSQRIDALNSVRKLSEVKDLIVRPLCQKLIKDTLPIREGWVKKEDMLDIQGRGRQRQIEMAEEFGITFYQNPGGGCLLTDAGFSRRLKDLVEHDMLELNFVAFLKVGRHFRLNDDIKIIIGRNNADNNLISQLVENELIVQTTDYPGPLGVINSKRNPTLEELDLIASILLRYTNKVENSAEVAYGKKFQLDNKIRAYKMQPEQVEKYIL